MIVPLRPGERWSLDFVSDQRASGRRFRILVIFDDCTRECLAAKPPRLADGHAPLPIAPFVQIEKINPQTPLPAG
jgi:transposase InsO family protein